MKNSSVNAKYRGFVPQSNISNEKKGPPSSKVNSSASAAMWKHSNSSISLTDALNEFGAFDSVPASDSNQNLKPNETKTNNRSSLSDYLGRGVNELSAKLLPRFSQDSFLNTNSQESKLSGLFLRSSDESLNLAILQLPIASLAPISCIQTLLGSYYSKKSMNLDHSIHKYTDDIQTYLPSIRKPHYTEFFRESHGEGAQHNAEKKWPQTWAGYHDTLSVLLLEEIRGAISKSLTDYSRYTTSDPWKLANHASLGNGKSRKSVDICGHFFGSLVYVHNPLSVSAPRSGGNSSSHVPSSSSLLHQDSASSIYSGSGEGSFQGSRIARRRVEDQILEFESLDARSALNAQFQAKDVVLLVPAPEQLLPPSMASANLIPGPYIGIVQHNPGKILQIRIHTSSFQLQKIEEFVSLKSSTHSRWGIIRVMNISSNLQSFQSISAVVYTPMSGIVLAPYTVRPQNRVSALEAVKAGYLTEGLMKGLEKRFDKSQMDVVVTVASGGAAHVPFVALGNDVHAPISSFQMKTGQEYCELTLAIGPPGTGKTRTLIATLSALRASVLNKRGRKILEISASNPPRNSEASIASSTNTSRSVSPDLVSEEEPAPPEVADARSSSQLFSSSIRSMLSPSSNKSASVNVISLGESSDDEATMNVPSNLFIAQKPASRAATTTITISQSAAPSLGKRAPPKIASLQSAAAAIGARIDHGQSKLRRLDVVPRVVAASSASSTHQSNDSNQFRALVCAPSNAAVDEIISRLVSGEFDDESVIESFEYGLLDTDGTIMKKPKVVRVGVGSNSSSSPYINSTSFETLSQERFWDLVLQETNTPFAPISEKNVVHESNAQLKTQLEQAKQSLITMQPSTSFDLIYEFEIRRVKDPNSPMNKTKLRKILIHDINLLNKEIAGYKALLKMKKSESDLLFLKAAALVLQESSIVCSTLVSSAQIAALPPWMPTSITTTQWLQAINSISFDALLIDEACQCIESECMIPFRLAYKGFSIPKSDALSGVVKPWTVRHCLKKVVMVGDPLQLPATVMSQSAEKAGLSVSLFERLVGSGAITPMLLKTQYRMTAAIAGFSVERFYRGLVTTKATVNSPDRKHAGAKPLIPRSFNPLSSSIMYLRIRGTMSRGNSSAQSPNSRVSTASLTNEEEARAVVDICHQIILQRRDHDKDRKLQTLQVGIIAMYKAQVHRIRDLLRDLSSQHFVHFSVATVDSFQGQEQDVIILSTVRSNSSDPSIKENGIGFVKDPRRLNVAITRAKHHLIIVGDLQKLADANDDWNALFDYALKHGTELDTKRRD
jgi:AAA domain